MLDKCALSKAALMQTQRESTNASVMLYSEGGRSNDGEPTMNREEERKCKGVATCSVRDNITGFHYHGAAQRVKQHLVKKKNTI